MLAARISTPAEGPRHAETNVECRVGHAAAKGPKKNVRPKDPAVVPVVLEVGDGLRIVEAVARFDGIVPDPDDAGRRPGVNDEMPRRPRGRSRRESAAEQQPRQPSRAGRRHLRDGQGLHTIHFMFGVQVDQQRT